MSGSERGPGCNSPGLLDGRRLVTASYPIAPLNTTADFDVYRCADDFPVLPMRLMTFRFTDAADDALTGQTWAQGLVL